jgi:hypothetical protein
MNTHALVTGGSYEYLSAAPAHVPHDRYLVHNNVTAQSPTFRAWLQDCLSDPPIVPCDCGWAPHLRVHYGVKRSPTTIE